MSGNRQKIILLLGKLVLLYETFAIYFLLVLFIFIQSCTTPPPAAEKRFGNDAPISKFEIPKYNIDLPLDENKILKEFVIKEKFLPFAIIQYRTPLLMKKDEENLYTALSESESLEKINPEEVEKRRPFLGICAFDLKTKKLKWQIPLYANSTNFPVTSKRLYVGQPHLFGNQLVVLKTDYVISTELEIIEKNTGRLIKTDNISGQGTFTFHADKYLIKFLYNNRFEMLNTSTGEKIWEYIFRDGSYKPSSGGALSLKLLSNDLLYYYYTYPDKFGFDVLDIATGKIVKNIEFKKSDVGDVFFNLLAFDKDYYYFRVSYCGKSGFSVHPPDCEYCEMIYDNTRKIVVKRTAYK